MIFMQCMKIIFVSIQFAMLPHSVPLPHKTSHLLPSNFNIEVCLITFALDYLPGPLDAPSNFSVYISNTSNTTFLLSWGAPFSLDVTDSPDISYYTLCTNIGCKNISSDPDCTFPRTCTSSVNFTGPSLNGTNGGQNKTMVDYGDTIYFTFFAVNGAGKGNVSKPFFFKKESGLYHLLCCSCCLILWPTFFILYCRKCVWYEHRHEVTSF